MRLSAIKAAYAEQPAILDDLEKAFALGHEFGLWRAAEACERHATFCEDEAHKGGAVDHLMTRHQEATYNAKRIRALQVRLPEKVATIDEDFLP
jgi:hypothetical protein